MLGWSKLKAFAKISWLVLFAFNAGKKVCLNQVSYSQAPGQESETHTTEPPGRGAFAKDQSNVLSFKESANAFKLDKFTILLCGKELII